MNDCLPAAADILVGMLSRLRDAVKVAPSLTDVPPTARSSDILSVPCAPAGLAITIAPARTLRVSSIPITLLIGNFNLSFDLIDFLPKVFLGIRGKSASIFNFHALVIPNFSLILQTILLHWLINDFFCLWNLP